MGDEQPLYARPNPILADPEALALLDSMWALSKRVRPIQDRLLSLLGERPTVDEIRVAANRYAIAKAEDAARTRDPHAHASLNRASEEFDTRPGDDEPEPPPRIAEARPDRYNLVPKGTYRVPPGGFSMLGRAALAQIIPVPPAEPSNPRKKAKTKPSKR